MKSQYFSSPPSSGSSPAEQHIEGVILRIRENLPHRLIFSGFEAEYANRRFGLNQNRVRRDLFYFIGGGNRSANESAALFRRRACSANG